jgi:Phage P22-like portal protein
MRQTKALQDIHREAIANFSDIWEVREPIVKECFEDRRFCDQRSAQWEGALGEQYENKPKFEVNKVHLAVQRIVNDLRNNPVDIRFVSKDLDDATKLADAATSLMRADEQDSDADDVTINGAQESIKGGFGAYRLRADYEDEDDPDEERQRIVYEVINDADLSVFFDLDARKQDKSDARLCFVLVPYTPAAYKAEFGDDPVTWPQDTSSHWGTFQWATKDTVWVAEYYLKESTKRWEYTYTGPLDVVEVVSEDDIPEDDNGEFIANLEARGFRETKRRRVETHIVKKYILSGQKVLDDCGEIPGAVIPIIPIYGKQLFLDGIEHCMGHVRNAKDPQRLANMMRSKLAEISMFSSVEKPIFSAEQIGPHAHIWADDDINDYKYLLAEPLRNPDGTVAHIGPLAYTKPPQVPPALAALIQVTEQDLSDVLGNPQNGEQVVSNVAEKTVQMIQDKLDMQTLIYAQNFAKALKRGAQVWLAMAKVLYSQKGRKMRGIDRSGEESIIEIGKPMIRDGVQVTENDLSKAKMRIVAEVGPSTSTKRKGVVRDMMMFAATSSDPDVKAAAEGVVLMNMEGEGLRDVNEWARKRMVSRGIIQPTEQEAKELAQAAQNAKPDANQMYLEAAAQEAAAKAGKAAADTELTKAKTLETLSNIENTNTDQALKVLDAVAPQTPQVDVVAVNPNAIP